MREYLKKHWLKILLSVTVILVLIPLGIAYLHSFRLIITDTSNEWIGFWGGYLGSIIGGVITLYVMWQTNKEARINLERTLNHEKEIALQESKSVFCDNLILKHSVWAESMEDMMTKTSLYIAYSEEVSALQIKGSEANSENMKYMIEFSNQLTKAKTLNYELYMHFSVKKNQKGFDSKTARELFELFGDVHDELQKCHLDALGGKLNTENIKKLFSDFNCLTDRVTQKVVLYVNEILS